MLYVVIPTLNAADSLSDLIGQLRALECKVAITDGGSNDGTLKIAVENNIRIISGSPGRGQQLARGAEYCGAKASDWYLFLHADGRLPENASALIAEHIERAPHKAGYFRFAMEDKGFWPLISEFWVGMRCLWLGLPYGDQGLLVSKALYDEIGGYKPMPLFEDFEIIRRLGGARLRVIWGKLITDCHKYRRDGYRKRTFRNLGLIIKYHKGMSVEELMSAYK